MPRTGADVHQRASEVIILILAAIPLCIVVLLVVA